VSEALESDIKRRDLILPLKSSMEVEAGVRNFNILIGFLSRHSLGLLSMVTLPASCATSS
jgi:hypothetical protein